MKRLREALTLLAILLPIAWLAHVYPTLPAIIPNHFDSDGVPHRFAPKAILWLLAGLSAGLYAMLQAFRHFPHSFNLPRPVGDPGRPRLEALGIELLSWINLEIAIMFAYSIWSLVQTALHRSSFHGDVFLFVPLLIIVATAIFFLVRMRHLTLAA